MNQSNTPTRADSPVHAQIREAGLDPTGHSAPETGPWEAYCDECYYHMWRLRRKTERGWNDGFHIHTGDEAKGLCELLNKFECDLGEARRLAEKYRNLSCETQDEADETLLPWEIKTHLRTNDDPRRKSEKKSR